MTLPDDPLLQSLGKLARERNEDVAQLERRWREAKDVRAPVSTKTSGTRPAADLEARAIAPFDDAERARLADHVRRHLRPAPVTVRNASPRTAAGQTVARSAKPAGQQPALKVLRGDATPLPGRRPQPPLRVADPLPVAEMTSILDQIEPRSPFDRAAGLRRAIALAVPLCAAAAAFFLWLQPSAAPIHDLPDYTLDVVGAPAEYRSAPSEPFDPAKLTDPIELGSGSRLVLSLRPATAVAEPIQTRVIVRQASGASRWPATVETSPQGAVRLQLERVSTSLRGPAELIVLVGHGESLPPGLDAGGLGWQRWSIPIVLAP